MNTFFSHRALESQRASGYRNTTYALAELIDNSLDASASNIRVLFLEKRDFNNRRYIDEILICDDGDGMSPAQLQYCLQFGGGVELGVDELVSTRRKGKFGYGLPNASLSQCPNVHVFSWQAAGAIMTTRLDLKEIRENESIEIPEVTNCELPRHYKQFGCVINEDHGVIVAWRDCDRLSNTRSGTIISKCAPLLGRLFRYLLAEGATISLEAYEFQATKQRFLPISEPLSVRPNDPLYLMENTLIAAPLWYESQRAESQSAKYYKPFSISETKCKPTNIRLKDHCYTYRFGWRDRAYEFVIKTSVADYHIQKPGIRSGADTKVGEFYDPKDRISFIRAGREIASGFFGGFYRTTEPQNRWWGIEVQFTGDADDLLGVHNNKQGIDFSLTDHISEDFDPATANLQQAREELWLELSRKIAAAQKAAWAEVRDANKRFTDEEKHLENEGGSTLPGGTSTTEETQVEVDGKRTAAFTAQERKALIARLSEKYPDVDQKQIVRSVERYDTIRSRGCVLYFKSDSDALWTYTTVYDFLIVLINTNHQFYDNILHPLREGHFDKALAALELFISSLAYEEKEHFATEQRRSVIEEFRSYVGLHLNRYIRKIRLQQAKSLNGDEDGGS